MARAGGRRAPSVEWLALALVLRVVVRLTREKEIGSAVRSPILFERRSDRNHDDELPTLDQQDRGRIEDDAARALGDEERPLARYRKPIGD